MSRRRFSELDVLETLVRQGVEIRCYRTKDLITLDTVRQLEREHVTELGLGGADDPTNCAYSLSAAHYIVTNGTPATTAGSSKNKIAKAKRIPGKMLVNKPPPSDARSRAGFARAFVLTPERRTEIASKAAKTRWAKRKFESRPFQRKAG